MFILELEVEGVFGLSSRTIGFGFIKEIISWFRVCEGEAMISGFHDSTFCFAVGATPGAKAPVHKLMRRAFSICPKKRAFKVSFQCGLPEAQGKLFNW
jgi:hypothetical protein